MWVLGPVCLLFIWPHAGDRFAIESRLIYALISLTFSLMCLSFNGQSPVESCGSSMQKISIGHACCLPHLRQVKAHWNLTVLKSYTYRPSTGYTLGTNDQEIWISNPRKNSIDSDTACGHRNRHLLCEWIAFIADNKFDCWRRNEKVGMRPSACLTGRAVEFEYIFCSMALASVPHPFLAFQPTKKIEGVALWRQTDI